MPASRIAFAFADLMGEVRGLRAKDDEPQAALYLDAVTYDATVRELMHHFGTDRLPPPNDKDIMRLAASHQIPLNHPASSMCKVGGMVIYTRRG